MAKEAEIVRLLRQYFQAFPKAEMPDSAWAMYGRALSPLTLEEINAAMLKLLRTAKFWPSVAEIFEAAKSVTETAQEIGLPTAAEAWEEVIAQARKNGLYRKWEYSCPEVEAALKAFGKEELCMTETAQVNTSRAQFMRMYKEICERKTEIRENNAVLDMLPTARKALRERATAKVLEIAEARRAAV